MPKTNVVLCAPVRTAIGTYGGSLKGITAADLGAAVIKAALQRAKLNGTDVDSVVMGQVVQAGAKMNPAPKRSFRPHRKSCLAMRRVSLQVAWKTWTKRPT
jgi:acetyl-CoA C-acetyltransferase